MKRFIKILAVGLLFTLLLVSCAQPPTDNNVETAPNDTTNDEEGPPPEEGVCKSELMADFESRVEGEKFVIGQNFDENDVRVSFETFIWGDGTPYAEGEATIQSEGAAGGAGNELWMNNITTRFILPCRMDNLTLYYGAHGGNLNIEVNGEFLNFIDMAVLDGKTWPSATSYIQDLGNGLGILTIEGKIWSFSIGGQELAIDGFCAEIVCEDCPEICVDFESQPIGTTYHKSDHFEENGVTVFFQPFLWSNGSAAPDGFAEIQGDGNAGGSGNELWINNINVRFIFPCEVEYLMMRFGEYGGNLNIEINGEFVNFEDFSDIEGAVIGGVEVHILLGGGQNDIGLVEFVGQIDSFMVGGQEFVIDDICNFGY